MKRILDVFGSTTLMGEKSDKTKRPTWGLRFLALTIVVLLAVWGLQHVGAGDRLKAFISRGLIKTVHLSPLPTGTGLPLNNAIYILAGSRRSMQRKFQTAAELYRQGAASKILLLSEPGIMEYVPSIERNPTYDEWAEMKLTELGVRGGDVEVVKVPIGFFGTLSEAKGIPPIVSERGYIGLVVVTSGYHARRTWNSFVRFADHKGLALYLYPAHEDVAFRHIISESLKLIFYDLFLV